MSGEGLSWESSCLDKALVNVPRSKIRDQLMEVGFDDVQQAETVGGLSGTLILLWTAAHNAWKELQY